MKTAWIRKASGLAATSMLALALCQSGVLRAQGNGPTLSIQPTTLLTWPESPFPWVLETGPDPAGPWTPCAGECSEAAGGYHRVYVAPDDQAKCYRTAKTLYYNFTNLSGWIGPDSRGTAVVTNGNLLLHFNNMAATPIDNWGNYAASMYPNASFSIPRTGTLEVRADVLEANQDDAFAGVSFWRTTVGQHNGYGVSKDQNEIIIWKCCGTALFHLEEVAIKNENITLSLALTPRGSDLEIRVRVFDRDNQNALLWERVVMDTPAADPTVPNGAWKGCVTDPDVNPAPYSGDGFLALLIVQYVNPQQPPASPGAEVIFDNFAVTQYEVAAQETEQGVVLSKDFTSLSDWNTNDTRLTVYVINDDVLLHFNRTDPTPIDNMGNWGGSIYPSGISLTMPTNGTVELRADVAGANQDDAFASVAFGSSPPLRMYGFSKDQNEIIIWKNLALFYEEEAAIKNTNITLSLALTPQGSDLEIHARVFDRDNQNALLWERVVMDTPAADPTVPSGSWKGLVTDLDENPAPYTGPCFLPFICCHYWNTQHYASAPGAEVIFDSFTLLRDEVPVLKIAPAAVLSWTEDPNPCRIMEAATSLPGPWTRLLTCCNNFVDTQHRTFVPVNEQARFFRLSEGCTVRIISWPASTNVQEGTNITLHVEATGPGPLSYEWRLDDEVIPGITGDSYTIPSAQTSDAGTYRVTVSDVCGSVTTDPLILTVLVKPTIVEHPQNQTVRVGDSVTFSVTVTNTATLPVGYRWRQAGTTVTNQVLWQHTAFYTIDNVQLSHAGDYTVAVTNAAYPSPGYLSNPGTLTVEP